METDWDKRYREGFYEGADKAHDFIARFPADTSGKPVIDIAMGNGRDLSFCRERVPRVRVSKGPKEAIKLAMQGRGKQARTHYPD